MMDNYEAYLPHIDAAEGIKRIMNNKKLYITMLGRFKVRQMADEVMEAIKSGDHERIVFAAHAIKGTSGNLGFPTLSKLSGEMEVLAKQEQDASHLVPQLGELVAVVIDAIADFVAKES
ncbi:MAG: Hpt domain-containing protein [Defluviitaleaceae bacterium]|nr:Hpt domain-containing protein [Defluviitaleaceae bacterium]